MRHIIRQSDWARAQGFRTSTSDTRTTLHFRAEGVSEDNVRVIEGTHISLPKPFCSLSVWLNSFVHKIF